MTALNKEVLIWLEIMRYVRTVSGTIYEDQLDKLLKQKYIEKNITVPDFADVVGFLNDKGAALALNGNASARFLTKHPITNEVYTIPESRAFLDPFIKEHTEKYDYNPSLYQSNFAYKGEAEIYDFSAEKGVFDACFSNGVFSYDESIGEFTLDFTRLKQNDGTDCIICKNFDFYEAVEAIKDRYGKIESNFHIGGIKASYIVFDGDFNLTYSDANIGVIRFSEGLDFSGTTFLGEVLIQNAEIDFSSAENQCLDFRNARLFKSFYMRNVNFIGTTNDSVCTFEDARISEDFEIYNTDFEHTDLYCFQMIFDEVSNGKRFYIVNTSFENDSHIDLIDVKITNADVKFENVVALPNTELCFRSEVHMVNGSIKDICPDIRLGILNSEIGGVLKISNISELTLENSHNYGRIIESNGWMDVDEEDWKKRYNKKYRTKTKGMGRTTINSKLLLAVYNNQRFNRTNKTNSANKLALIKCNDFLLLKENFLNLGYYEFEDVAYILYMEFKPFFDSHLKGVSRDKLKEKKLTKVIYKLLYAVGKYGISPLRVCNSIAVAILVFSLVYFAIAFGNPQAHYAFGELRMISDTIAGQALSAILYSLACIVPFISQFEPLSMQVVVVSAIENFIGTFLIGYFSVAVIRKTLR